MEFKDVLAMYFERGMALQTYWNFYLTIVVGYLAFLGVLPESHRSERLSVLLIVGFILFAWVNLSGLIGVSRQRIEIQRLLTEEESLERESYPTPANLMKLRATFNASSVSSVVSFHLLVDALLIGSIWVIPAIR